ncbi:GNAT family N-acetyltransferase [Vulcaniibacterium gelatinicum]|uniref:GNAT family N-acetyltransferase n=1 Tax=Vulcaniibacterium gelatinicum TaxID=2598725 RepID=UPI001C709BE4
MMVAEEWARAIGHDPARGRFSLLVEGHEGFVDYLLDGSTMTITHTVVPAPIGGRGIAAALVRAALDHARAQGWRVVPRCSYADAWMRRHPEYEGLRADAPPPPASGGRGGERGSPWGRG